MNEQKTKLSNEVQAKEQALTKITGLEKDAEKLNHQKNQLQEEGQLEKAALQSDIHKLKESED